MIDRPEVENKKPLNLLTKRIDEVDLGRRAPQHVEMEKAILAAIMIDKDAIDVATEILKPDSFYLPSHNKIFHAAITLADKFEPIDIAILADQLSKDGTLEMCGGSGYLIELTNTIASSANLEFHCRIVAQKHIQRELIRLSHETIKDAYTPTKDVFEVIDRIETQVSGLFNDSTVDPTDGVDLFDDSIETVLELKNNPREGLHGLNTGNSDLNDITGGWRSGDLIIIAGRPGMGKTAFALSQLISHDGISAFFSLEMPETQIAYRLMSANSGVPYAKIERGEVSDDEVNRIKKSRAIFEKIIIDDSHSLTIAQLKRKAKKIKSKNPNLKSIVIDYLQLLKPNEKKGTREQEVSQISGGLKILAKELDVPVIALAQLSRGVDARSDKRPLLSDLRESGSLEQDADIVIFTHRPEYYDKDAKDADGNSLEGIAEIIVAKHRSGRTDTAKAKFIGELMKFTNLNSEPISLVPPARTYKAITSDPNFDKAFLGDNSDDFK